MHTHAPAGSPTVDDPDAPRGLLTTAQEAALLRRIDAGVAADAALRGDLPAPAGAHPDELAAVVADGDRARATLAEANTGLVWYVVLPVAERTGLDRHELFQEGMVGLLEAIARFDPARGRFATAALPRIRMRTWDAAVTGHGALGLPPRRARQWRRAQAVLADLTATLARTPRNEELAAATGESVGVVQALLAFAPPVAVDRDDDRWAAPEAFWAGGVDVVAVRRLLRRLAPSDRALIVQLYGLDGPVRSHADLARETGRSESTVRRRERAALELLRRADPEDLVA